MNRQTTWEKLQAAEVQSYRAAYKRQGNYQGFFSINEYTDAYNAGLKIAERCTCCLDVGCGVLPRPSYMQLNHTAFFGIDPFFGEHKRMFPFVQAIGEHLPFPDGYFPCVSFMSTLDHQIEPAQSLKEANRVLSKNGLLFLWLELRAENDARYQQWKTQPKGALFDDHHQHAFIQNDIMELLNETGFLLKERINFPGTHYFPPTKLIIGTKI